jgi:hypothetical protein
MINAFAIAEFRSCRYLSQLEAGNQVCRERDNDAL